MAATRTEPRGEDDDMTPEEIREADWVHIVPGLEQLADTLIEHAPTEIVRDVTPDWWNDQVVLRDDLGDAWIRDVGYVTLLHRGPDGIHGTHFRNRVGVLHSEHLNGEPRVTSSQFTSLGQVFSQELGAGRQLDLDATLAHIHDPSLFEWLANQLPNCRGCWFLDDEPSMLGVFERVSQACGDLGIAGNGLALLVAYCFEGVKYDPRLQ
jgi:hypothetical protein